MADEVLGFRLSPQQQWLWALASGGDAYRTRLALVLEGALKIDALRQALDGVVARHQALRTDLVRTPGLPHPLQVVRERGSCDWHVVDKATGPPEAVVHQLFLADDTSAGVSPDAPLLRARVTALDDRRHMLVLSAPSLCCDGESLRLIAVDLAELYGAGGEGSSGAESVPYLQYSEWANDVLEEAEAPDADSWAALDARLLTEAGLASGTGTAFRQVPGMRQVAVPLDEERSLRIASWAERYDVPRSTVLLALWQSLLARLKGSTEVAVACVLEGRVFPEVEESVGPFCRSVPVRVSVDPSEGFAEVLEWTRDALQAAEAIHELYRPGRFLDPGAPAERFPVGFENLLLPEPRRAGGLLFAPLAVSARSDRFQLALVVEEAGEHARLRIEYEPSLYVEAEVERLAERLMCLLDAVGARPAAPLVDLGLVGEGERRWLLAHLQGPAAPAEALRPWHVSFLEWADRRPEAAAVRRGGEELTYGELGELSRRLARRLQARGIGRGDLVAICLHRGLDLPVALLGVHRTGAAYLLLDPTDPGERLALVVEDASPDALVVEEATRELVPAGPVTVRVEEDPGGAAEPEGEIDELVDPQDLAYVLYTSGSTGRPKGVMVPHRGLSNYLAWAVDAYGLEAGGASPVHSSVAFDLTVTSLLAPLAAGGCVVTLPEEEGFEALTGAIRRGDDFALVKVTPSHLELLRRSLAQGGVPGAVDVLVLGGEALMGESLAYWRTHAPRTRLVNEYGPTETVVGCAAFELPPGQPAPGAVPIGKPLAGVRLGVMDARGAPAPAGRPGELWVGGAGVSRGYHRRPGATAASFVPEPAAAAPGARAYRTGDVVLLRPDGELVFLGRLDDQIKVRGHRVEPGEVEAALREHREVGEAVVVLRLDGTEDRSLVAYVTPAAGRTVPGNEALRAFLVERLPEYMVPVHYVRLDALPLAASGKVDRRALPDPSGERPELEREYRPPSTRLEETLVQVWSAALGIDRVGVDDGFFALGGDSIRSVRAVARAQEEGIELTVQELFQNPTVAGMARLLEETGRGDDAEAELARLLDEVETLSEDEVRRRLDPQGAEVQGGSR